MLTLILCGFWHGANWTFILWGGYNGMILCVEALFKNTIWPGLIPKSLKIMVTFHLFAAGLIFVRAENFSQAAMVFKSFFNCEDCQINTLSAFAYPMILAAVFYLCHPWDHIDGLKKMRSKVNPALMTTILFLIWTISVMLSAIGGGSSKFLYFDF